MHNLHPDVAENPRELVVYGGIGRAARTSKDFDISVESLKNLEVDEAQVAQSGKPIAVSKTHADAPRVLSPIPIRCRIGRVATISTNCIRRV